MCGIVGYIGNNAVADNLLDGLKSLEYRGYDSSGVALNDNGNIDVFRAEGKLANLYDVLASQKQKTKMSCLGIGHIRWATHGGATIDNAHPHKSNDGKLVLVHNGIIENYKELRLELQNKGYRFYSETDTESAVHLIADMYKKQGNLEQAAVSAIQRLKGAFAFCIMHQDEPDKIIAVRKNAPLIVGLGKNENFIASDIPALIGKVDNIIYLDDNEYAIVEQNRVRIKNFNGLDVLKKPEKMDWTAEAVSKHGYKHFMLKEINEQPDIIRNQLAACMDGAFRPVSFKNFSIEDLLSGVKRIEIIACGTSLHAAMVARCVLESFCKIPVMVEAASEYIYKSHLGGQNTLAIGISQSGETADTITAMKQAKKFGAKILAITNREDSSIVRYADMSMPLMAGIEVSVAATKSYTAQLMCLYLLAVAAAEYYHSLPVSEIVSLKQELLQIPVKMEEILNSSDMIKKCAQTYAAEKSFIFIGRGINVPSVQEGALKLKEISYINANAYAAGELKHGPIALLDEHMPVVAVLISGTELYDKMLSNCEEAKARKAKLIAVSSSEDLEAGGLFDSVIRIPKIPEMLSPLLVSAPLQLLAYYTADFLGKEVDQPRNLAKSVTVE